MDNMLNEEMLNGEVAIVEVGSEKKAGMAVVIIAGVAGIAAGWLGNRLYKKFKQRKTKKTEVIVDVLDHKEGT